jgi:hypothetical protein
MMVVLLPHMVSPTMDQSQCLYALPKMLDFYDLEKPIFGILNQITWDTRTQLYKTHNTGKTGMNGIRWEVMTFKAVNSTVSEELRPFFFYFASTNSRILS